MTADQQDSEQSEAERKPTKWEDPSVPAGNAPPMPKWPLPVMGVAWVAWVGFLAAVKFGLP